MSACINLLSYAIVKERKNELYADAGNPDIHQKLVEVNGIEPMTSCVQGRRSPS
jgi:hypothetical protein